MYFIKCLSYINPLALSALQLPSKQAKIRNCITVVKFSLLHSVEEGDRELLREYLGTYTNVINVLMCLYFYRKSHDFYRRGTWREHSFWVDVFLPSPRPSPASMYRPLPFFSTLYSVTALFWLIKCNIFLINDKNKKKEKKKSECTIKFWEPYVS